MKARHTDAWTTERTRYFHEQVSGGDDWVNMVTDEQKDTCLMACHAALRENANQEREDTLLLIQLALTKLISEASINQANTCDANGWPV